MPPRYPRITRDDPPSMQPQVAIVFTIVSACRADLAHQQV